MTCFERPESRPHEPRSSGSFSIAAQGAQYLGLYTLVEVPDEPMLESQFGSEDGNLYKPNGTGARWTQFIAESFPKKTNQSDEDWTDVQDAIAVLNEPRTSPAAWRARLEARFAVPSFLRWLALNTIIGNTDTYGGFSPHNYWVYGSPRHRDRLFFIPWDHDLAHERIRIGRRADGWWVVGGGGARSVSRQRECAVAVDSLSP